MSKPISDKNLIEHFIGNSKRITHEMVVKVDGVEVDRIDMSLFVIQKSQDSWFIDVSRKVANRFFPSIRGIPAIKADKE